MEEQLKPCPFCGHEVEITEETSYYGTKTYRIDCDNCCTHTYVYTTKEDLIAHWNHRSNAPLVKQCPFCGAGANVDATENRIMCSNCGAHTDMFETIQEAIAEWNHRVQERED